MQLALRGDRQLDLVLDDETRHAIGVDLHPPRDGAWSQALLHCFPDGVVVHVIRLSERLFDHRRSSEALLRSVDGGRTWTHVAASEVPWLESTPLESLACSEDSSIALSMITPPHAPWGSVDVLLADRTRIRTHARVFAFNRRTEDYSGIRAEWSDAALFRDGGALALRVGRVVDWQGGIGLEDDVVFESSDGGRSWTDGRADAVRRAALAPTTPLVRCSAYRPFI